MLSWAMRVIPLQLLACHSVMLRGLDEDLPRNLAKGVTVDGGEGRNIAFTLRLYNPVCRNT
jgi:hypothetical protein